LKGTLKDIEKDIWLETRMIETIGCWSHPFSKNQRNDKSKNSCFSQSDRICCEQS